MSKKWHTDGNAVVLALAEGTRSLVRVLIVLVVLGVVLMGCDVVETIEVACDDHAIKVQAGVSIKESAIASNSVGRGLLPPANFSKENK